MVDPHLSCGKIFEMREKFLTTCIINMRPFCILLFITNVMLRVVAGPLWYSIFNMSDLMPNMLSVVDLLLFRVSIVSLVIEFYFPARYWLFGWSCKERSMKLLEVGTTELVVITTWLVLCCCNVLLGDFVLSIVCWTESLKETCFQLDMLFLMVFYNEGVL